MADVEVVIKMDEKYFNGIKDFAKAGNNFSPWKEIANGAQLPKGHGRLKDVDWIDDNCEYHHSDKDGSWCYSLRDIDDAPTIIEADKESEEKDV